MYTEYDMRIMAKPAVHESAAKDVLSLLTQVAALHEGLQRKMVDRYKRPCIVSCRSVHYVRGMHIYSCYGQQVRHILS